MADDTSNADETGTAEANPTTHHDANATGGDDRTPEVGGRDGPDPTRYGDWEKNGRCIDF